MVRGVTQQRMVAAVVVVERRLAWRLLDRLVPVPDDAHFAEVLVPQVPEVLVLVSVSANVLVAVRRFSGVPVLVRHLATVLVVVHYFAGVDKRYTLAGQLICVNVIHMLRHFFGHHDDDPMVSVQNVNVPLLYDIM